MKEERKYELQLPNNSKPEPVWGIDVTIECEQGGDPFTYRQAGLGSEPSLADIGDLISMADRRVRMCGHCPLHCRVNQLSRTRYGWIGALRKDVMGK